MYCWKNYGPKKCNEILQATRDFDFSLNKPESNNTLSCTRYERIDYNPTTFSDNPVSLVHLSNASAEAMKAVREEIESPDFTDAKKSKA